MDQATPTEVRIVPVTTEAELLQALAIREIVFIEEQRVPEGIERDEEDGRAYHVLAIEDGHAIGTGRVVLNDPEAAAEGAGARIGRMAVLQASRKTGTGGKLLSALEAEAARKGVDRILLHAQMASCGFYEKHGYERRGGEFDEAGMTHVRMVKQLR